MTTAYFARNFRYVVVRTTDIYGDPPAIVGRFKHKRRADEFAWRCAIRYIVPDVEISYTVYPVAWDVKGVPS